jgi:hypothetical protein
VQVGPAQDAGGKHAKTGAGRRGRKSRTAAAPNTAHSASRRAHMHAIVAGPAPAPCSVHAQRRGSASERSLVAAKGRRPPRSPAPTRQRIFRRHGSPLLLPAPPPRTLSPSQLLLTPATRYDSASSCKGRLNSIGNILFVGLFYYLRKNSLFVGYCSCDNSAVLCMSHARVSACLAVALLCVLGTSAAAFPSPGAATSGILRPSATAVCQCVSPPSGRATRPTPPELRAPGLTVRGAHLPQVVGRGGPCDVGAPAGTSCPRDRRR